jgi:hypothetical protein
MIGHWLVTVLPVVVARADSEFTLKLREQYCHLLPGRFYGG